MNMKIVIVGGVAGGMSAATRLRRLNEDAEIVVLERSGYVSFANCGLPYFVGGVITDRPNLLLQTPASLGARFALDVRVKHEVTGIDREAKTVTVTDLEQGTSYTENYDYLVLSPGAAPFVPDMPGKERALKLRDVEDVDALAKAVGESLQWIDAERLEADHAAQDNRATAVVMGAGFIGLEMAENLVHRGMKVTVVELADQVMAPLDPEMAIIVQNKLADAGVDVRTSASVTAIGDASVTLSTGEEIGADVVVAAIGVRPESTLATAIGLEVGARGGIVVDDQQRTSDPAIFAVGDAVEKRDLVDGGVAMVPLANPANRQGRLVADIISGRDVHNKQVQGTAIVGVFGLQAAVMGWNEKRLKAAGRPYVAIHTHPMNHAGYYPGAEGMSLKLLVDPESGALLGAQGIGGSGVDKRIDVLATAMRGGITAPELADLELAYAPQFGSAKDPVNMLGYIAENILTGTTDTLQWHELGAEQAKGLQVIDVRTPGEFSHGAIPGAINIPVDELRARMDEVNDESIVHCQVGLRGHIAARIIAQHGKHTRNLDGGYRTWAPAATLVAN